MALNIDDQKRKENTSPFEGVSQGIGDLIGGIGGIVGGTGQILSGISGGVARVAESVVGGTANYLKENPAFARGAITAGVGLASGMSGIESLGAGGQGFQEERKFQQENQSKLKPVFKEIQGKTVLVDQSSGTVLKNFGENRSPLNAKDFANAKSAYDDVIGLQKAFSEMSEEDLQSNIIKMQVGTPGVGRDLKGAAENAIDVMLRQRTGAVIAPEERAKARESFIPQKGDSRENIAKKLQRLEAIYSLQIGGIDQNSPEAQDAINAVGNVLTPKNRDKFINNAGVTQSAFTVEAVEAKLGRKLTQEERLHLSKKR